MKYDNLVEEDKLGSLTDSSRFEAGLPSESLEEVEETDGSLEPSFLPGPLPTQDPIRRLIKRNQTANSSNVGTTSRLNTTTLMGAKNPENVTIPAVESLQNISAQSKLERSIKGMLASEQSNQSMLNISHGTLVNSTAAALGSLIPRLSSNGSLQIGNMSIGGLSLNATSVGNITFSNVAQFMTSVVNKNAKDVLGEVTQVRDSNVLPEIPDQEPVIHAKADELDNEQLGGFGATEAPEVMPETILPDMDEDIQFPDDEEESDADSSEIHELLKKGSYDDE